MADADNSSDENNYYEERPPSPVYDTALLRSNNGSDDSNKMELSDAEIDDLTDKIENLSIEHRLLELLNKNGMPYAVPFEITTAVDQLDILATEMTLRLESLRERFLNFSAHMEDFVVLRALLNFSMPEKSSSQLYLKALKYPLEYPANPAHSKETYRTALLHIQDEVIEYMSNLKQTRKILSMANLKEMDDAFEKSQVVIEKVKRGRAIATLTDEGIDSIFDVERVGIGILKHRPPEQRRDLLNNLKQQAIRYHELGELMTTLFNLVTGMVTNLRTPQGLHAAVAKRVANFYIIVFANNLREDGSASIKQILSYRNRIFEAEQVLLTGTDILSLAEHRGTLWANVQELKQQMEADWLPLIEDIPMLKQFPSDVIRTYETKFDFAFVYKLNELANDFEQTPAFYDAILAYAIDQDDAEKTCLYLCFMRERTHYLIQARNKSTNQILHLIHVINNILAILANEKVSSGTYTDNQTLIDTIAKKATRMLKILTARFTVLSQLQLRYHLPKFKGDKQEDRYRIDRVMADKNMFIRGTLRDLWDLLGKTRDERIRWNRAFYENQHRAYQLLSLQYCVFMDTVSWIDDVTGDELIHSEVDLKLLETYPRHRDNMWNWLHGKKLEIENSEEEEDGSITRAANKHSIHSDELSRVWLSLVEMGERIRAFRRDVYNFDILRQIITQSHRKGKYPIYNLIFEVRMLHYETLHASLSNAIEDSKAEVQRIEEALIKHELSGVYLSDKMREYARRLMAMARASIERCEQDIRAYFPIIPSAKFVKYHVRLGQMRSDATRTIEDVKETIRYMRTISKNKFKATLLFNVFVAQQRIRQLMLKLYSIDNVVYPNDYGLEDAFECLDQGGFTPHVEEMDVPIVEAQIRYYQNTLGDIENIYRIVISGSRAAYYIHTIHQMSFEEYKNLATVIQDQSVSDPDDPATNEEDDNIRSTAFPVLGNPPDFTPINYFDINWIMNTQEIMTFAGQVRANLMSIQKEFPSIEEITTTPLPINYAVMSAAQFNDRFDEYKILKLHYKTLVDAIPKPRQYSPNVKLVQTTDHIIHLLNEVHTSLLQHFELHNLSGQPGYPSLAQMITEGLHASYEPVIVRGVDNPQIKDDIMSDEESNEDDTDNDDDGDDSDHVNRDRAFLQTQFIDY